MIAFRHANTYCSVDSATETAQSQAHSRSRLLHSGARAASKTGIMEAGSNTLPFMTGPHDALRQGLVTLKDGSASAHPVETIQKMMGPASEGARLEMLRNLYGTALPARMQIERQMLDRVERLPGLPSSKLGLESLTGALDDFGFEDYLCLPADSETAPADLHSQMEQRLGLAAGTKPMARGLNM